MEAVICGEGLQACLKVEEDRLVKCLDIPVCFPPCGMNIISDNRWMFPLRHFGVGCRSSLSRGSAISYMCRCRG